MHPCAFTGIFKYEMEPSTVKGQQSIAGCLSNSMFHFAANVELLDLPDEMLLMIMQKLTRNVELLSSLIGVGNARLENLALERSSIVDLTYDFLSSPWKRIIERFLSHTLPRIYNNIESLAMNLEHLSCVTRVASSTPERNFPHLKQLKIIRSRRLPYSGIPITTGEHDTSPRSQKQCWLFSPSCSRMFQRQ